MKSGNIAPLLFYGFLLIKEEIRTGYIINVIHGTGVPSQLIRGCISHRKSDFFPIPSPFIQIWSSGPTYRRCESAKQTHTQSHKGSWLDSRRSHDQRGARGSLPPL